MNRKISNTSRLVVLLSCAALLQACSSTAQFKSTAPGTTMSIRGASDKTEMPRSEDLSSKATTQYEFVATAPQSEPLYGILPLKVNAGKIVMSIMFFAPALFIGGFRDAYGFYEYDPASKSLRYKFNETDDWYTYVPTKSESDRAKNYFDSIAPECKVGCPATAAVAPAASAVK
jgi:hypothetical protein